MSKDNTTEPQKCSVQGCFVVRGQMYAGIPPCERGWAGDPKAMADYLRGCVSKNQTTRRNDPDRATWTMAELALIFSTRDQIALNRRCERSIGSLCGMSSLTNPCECLEDAAKRVGADLMEGENGNW